MSFVYFFFTLRLNKRRSTAGDSFTLKVRDQVKKEKKNLPSLSLSSVFMHMDRVVVCVCVFAHLMNTFTCHLSGERERTRQLIENLLRNPKKQTLDCVCVMEIWGPPLFFDPLLASRRRLPSLLFDL